MSEYDHDHEWRAQEGRNAGSAECLICRETLDWGSICFGLREQLKLEREAAAAYAQDRSEQYTDESSAKVALEDFAAALLVGQHIMSARHGELDDLIKWHRKHAKKRLIRLRCKRPRLPAKGGA